MSETYSSSSKPPRLWIEGNKGGTYIEIVATPIDGIIELEIGHDCVVQMKRKKIRVYDLASVLLDADRRWLLPPNEKDIES